MKLPFSDEQIAKLFDLTAEIAAVRQEMPAAPKGFDVGLELARALRSSLEKHGETLVSLAQLLEPVLDPILRRQAS